MRGSEDLYICWFHHKFEEETGFEGLPTTFSWVLEWLDNLSPREFLIPCAMYLKLLGASKIFITDSSGDEGIDCLGVVYGGYTFCRQ